MSSNFTEPSTIISKEFMTTDNDEYLDSMYKKYHRDRRIKDALSVTFYILLFAGFIIMMIWLAVWEVNRRDTCEHKGGIITYGTYGGECIRAERIPL